LSQNDGMPIFYVTYSGSITDKTHLPYMMAYNAELGIDDGCFVTDRGFCTESNIKHMHSTGSFYICGADTDQKTISSAVINAADNMISMRNFIKQGIYSQTIHSQFYGEATSLHIYLDTETAERQRKDIYRDVENADKFLSTLKQLTKKEAKRYSKYFDINLTESGAFTHQRNYDKIDSLTKKCGFFGILANKDATGEDALATYRRKDVIEKGFDELKNHIDMKRLRTHNSATTDGKMLVAFIALIAVSRLSSRLSDFMKAKSMSKDGLISELEKIKMVTMSNGLRLMNPITKTQRNIFEICNLSENDLKRYISQS